MYYIYGTLITFLKPVSVFAVFTTTTVIRPLRLSFESAHLEVYLRAGTGGRGREAKRCSFCTCIQAFRTRVALLVALTTSHLHQLRVEGVEDVPIDRVHGVGQLHTQDT